MKKISSTEKDPITGKSTQWKGVSLSGLLDPALAELPPEQRATVDLVILRNPQGEQALLPRSFLTKYPVLLALNPPADRGESYVVVPWTSKGSKIQSEELPLETYFISNLSRIELTNYKDRFAGAFLKRRTDPAAIRGEKLFVQSCMGCHSSGHAPTLTDISAEPKTRALASTSHPTVRGAIRLSEKERRSLVSYLNEIRAENAVPAQVSASSH